MHCEFYWGFLEGFAVWLFLEVFLLAAWVSWSLDDLGKEGKGTFDLISLIGEEMGNASLIL